MPCHALMRVGGEGHFRIADVQERRAVTHDREDPRSRRAVVRALAPRKTE